MENSKNIPVCNLFSESEERDGSAGDFFNESPLAKSSNVSESIVNDEANVALASPAAKEPAVCNIFASVSSSEDLFASMLTVDSGNKVDEETQLNIPSVPAIKEEIVMNDGEGTSQSEKTNDDVFHVPSESQIKHDLSEIFDHVIAEELVEDIHSNSTAVKDAEVESLQISSDVMASIMINDDSYENIPQIPLEIALKVDEKDAESETSADEIPVEISQEIKNYDLTSHSESEIVKKTDLTLTNTFSEKMTQPSTAPVPVVLKTISIPVPNEEASSYDLAPETISADIFENVSSPKTSSDDPFENTSTPKTLSDILFENVPAPQTISDDPFENVSTPKTLSEDLFENILAPKTISDDPFENIPAPKTISDDPFENVSTPKTLSNNQIKTDSSPIKDVSYTKQINEIIAEEDVVSPAAPLASTLFATSTSSSSFDNIGQENTFLSSSDDAFTSALTTSEIDRRRDAWIPSENARTVLNAVAQSQTRITLESECLTRPGLGSSESLGDPVKTLLGKRIELAAKRKTLTGDMVSHDQHGLRKLMNTGNLRAAADLCGMMLTELGQGFGKATQESTNSPQTLQWWLARLSLLLHLRLYELAEAELNQFSSLDAADLYFGFYPDLYPGRKGSMVPFSLRLLYANFPRHIQKPTDALSRLYHLQSVCNKIIENLQSNKTEDGTPVQLKAEDHDASLKLWKERKVNVLFCIGNTLLQLREYNSAIKTYESVLEISPSNAIALHSGIGRMLLQVGDIKAAQTRFAQVERLAANDPQYQVQLIMNRGFLYLGANNWPEALNQFTNALKLDPTNLEALNNKSVCNLYLCNLKEAIALQESAQRLSEESPQKDPKTLQMSQEASISNLVTLYELESSRSLSKKQALLERVALTSGDGFNVACLKM